MALASRKTAAAAPSSIESPSGVPAKIQQVVGCILEQVTGYRLQVTSGYKLQIDTAGCQSALSEKSKPSKAYGHGQN